MTDSDRRPSARRPHVLVVGHRVADQVFGAERSLLEVLDAIDRRAYEVSCVLPAANASYVSAVARRAGSVSVFPYAWWSLGQPLDENVVAGFASLLRSTRVDLVHVNTITLMEPLIAARRVGVPSILHARELITEDPTLAARLGGDGAAIARTVSAAADFIVANSEATLRLYGKDGRSFRLYNGIDVDRFDLSNEPAAGRLRVGIISSNEPNKGIDDFIRLAVLASRRHPGLAFVVIGPRTPRVVELERMAREVAPSVNLCVSDYVADPVDAIGRVNVVVSFSLVAESFGRTVVEAMAARRPVIAYGWGAVPELVRHGVDGFLVPYLDFASALDHLVALADHPERVREMGRNARRRAARQFSQRMFAARLNEIYDRVMTRSTAAGPSAGTRRTWTASSP